MTSASLKTETGTKTLFEIYENEKISVCAPEVVVISGKIVKNMRKEEKSRWTEMIIDLHEEEFSGVGEWRSQNWERFPNLGTVPKLDTAFK